jgi:hypothetical protein
MASIRRKRRPEEKPDLAAFDSSPELAIEVNLPSDSPLLPRAEEADVDDRLGGEQTAY